ncbi:MAG: aldehyde ferredoxin oxidoreductase C-terminal domain-containing protein, partial [Dehalococcoidia bacterium]|nr:aldehyde ferredoxin oxidoreductase C-terminal domain-containing protein [Dehalococcoidia bacterium]
GLDSISCGAAIAFGMECFERGLLTTNDTAGLDLRFGNGPAMLEMVESIALRQGLGGLLAEGVARAAEKIGNGSEELALHIKGQEIPMHEPRWKQGMGIGYAMSPTGADHCHNMHDSAYSGMSPGLEFLAPLGVLDTLPVDDLSPAKMRLLIYKSLLMHFFDCSVCCFFVMIYGQVGLQRVVDLVASVTGWDTSLFELMKVGERAANLARAFNIREGFTLQDDSIPHRFFTPHASGPIQGVAPDPQAFLRAKEIYYDMMGWPGGRPSPGKLGELGIEWAIPLVEMGQPRQ